MKVSPKHSAKNAEGLALRKGGLLMVTYSDLIQVGILIVGICSLFIQVRKKK